MSHSPCVRREVYKIVSGRGKLMGVSEGRWSFGAAAMIAGWYAFAWLTVRPLTGAPVVDSWVYQHAVTALANGGVLRFAGYTEAMPVGQVIYGLAWTRLFGAGSPSFDLSVAVLGMAGALVLDALARRCGAKPVPAMLATGLLICNPCYLFLSFSFMTEIPFLLPFLASLLAFTRADGASERRWLWLAALLAVVAFSVRPFGGAALIGCGAALVVYDRELWRGAPGALARTARRLAPFACAFVVCGAFWICLVRDMRPWHLTYNESRVFEGFFLVPVLDYLKMWVLGPLLYLGLVLAPLALVHAAARWRRASAIALGIFALAVLVTAVEDHFAWAIPDCRCFGGWSGALTLRGMPRALNWTQAAGGAAGWIVAALGSVGAAGLSVAAIETIPRIGRGAAAVLLTAAVYWLATLPLWLFSDRYYLLLVPAGCLLLALAPLPRGRGRSFAAAAAMTAVMGLMSLGGLYSYQRGAQAVLEARNALLARGIPRSAIDAGYPLDGQDLYRYPRGGIETPTDERGIAMVTSSEPRPYMITAAPIAGAAIVRQFSWPGPFGIGARRPLYVLRMKAPYNVRRAR